MINKLLDAVAINVSDIIFERIVKSNNLKSFKLFDNQIGVFVKVKIKRSNELTMGGSYDSKKNIVININYYKNYPSFYENIANVVRHEIQHYYYHCRNKNKIYTYISLPENPTVEQYSLYILQDQEVEAYFFGIKLLSILMGEYIDDTINKYMRHMFFAVCNAVSLINDGKKVDNLIKEFKKKSLKYIKD